MKYTLILDRIFGHKPKVRALRFLAGPRPSATVSEVAREIGLSTPNASLALRELEAEGILRAQKAGRSILYSLNHGHYLVERFIKPAFGREREAKQDLGKRLAARLSFPYESLILFGSISRGEERPDSDIDLAVIVPDKADPDVAEAAVFEANPAVIKEFGNALSPAVFNKSRFLAMLKSGHPLAREIADQGELLSGKLVSELL
jgi:predicted nucleotidyltransferase